jgi:predicted TIM-barrel fold metal-dependent hydrolase
MSAPVFANHAHVFPADFKPEGSVDRLRKLMDACGIACQVCFAPFALDFPDGFDVNNWLAQEIRGRNEFIGFGTIDFRRSDLSQQVRRCADHGFRGLKLHPNIQHFDLTGDAAFEVYGAAQELDLFASFHSGVHNYRIADYNVLKFDEVAYRFPDFHFSMEHVGGWAFFGNAVGVISNNIPFPPIPGRKCRVYGGLASVFTASYNRQWYMSPERMTELVAQVGAEQLIFGLDFPYNLEENTLTALAAIDALGLSSAQREMILGGNLRQVLKLN